MSRPKLQVVANPPGFDPELMNQVKASVALKRSITARWNARRDRLTAQVRANSNTPGYDLGYVQDILGPREDIRAASQAIYDAVGAGASDVVVIQDYACAAAVVERQQAKLAFNSLRHDGVISLGSSYVVTPGPHYDSWQPPVPEV